MGILDNFENSLDFEDEDLELQTQNPHTID